MDFRIYELRSAEDLRPLRALSKERVDMKYYDDCRYLGAFVDGVLVGVVGCQRLSRTTLRYKTDGVLPAYRNRGIYSLLWAAREARYNTGRDTITAFCTEKSLGCYLAHGFRALRTRDGITFVKRA